VNLKEIECKDMDWIHVALDRVSGRLLWTW